MTSCRKRESASTGAYRKAAWVCAAITKLQSSRHIIQEPQPAELPARRRREEIAIARARVAGRRRERAAAKNHLIDHELAIVLAERVVGRAVARIGQVCAARPLPDNAVGIIEEVGA